MINNPTFAEVYSQAVDQALSSLGDRVSAVVINYLSERYSVRLSDTSDNPKALADALDIAIDGGARVIQRRILRLIYEKIGTSPPSNMTLNFEEKIEKARQDYKKYMGV